MIVFILAVFIAVYVGMALGRLPGLQVDRTGVALLGAILLLVGGAVGGDQAMAAIDFPTILVLLGLMILSAQFALAGFYDWCAVRITRAAASPEALLALVVAVGGGLSAVLANDVVVFAMTPLLCVGLQGRGLDARPYLIALAGAANAGSAATVIGNPQNILIGEAGNLAFWPFLAACGPPALIALAIVYATVRLVWRGRLVAGSPGAPADLPPFDRWQLAKGAAGTLLLLGLFATTLPRETSVLAVAGIMLVSRQLASRRMLGLVDWHLLVLFAALFTVTGALAATGLPARLLEGLAGTGFGLERLSVLVPLSLIASNSIGNVPAVVLLIQIWHAAPPGALYALALLSTLAGNLLLLGSLANLIVLERAAAVGVRLGFAEHARCGIPMTLASTLVAVLWLVLAGHAGL